MEHAILESIFDAEIDIDADRYLNIFREDKDLVPVTQLTKEEKFRNAAFCAMAVFSIFAMYYRADFLTLLIFVRLYQYFEVKWTTNHYWKFGLALSISLFYDLLW